MRGVVASFCMSLDGFVARPDDDVGPLFDWYQAGDVEVPMVGYPMTFRVAPASAQYLGTFLDSVRHSAFVCGRRVFDHTHGWGGHPPGDGTVGVSGPSIAQQCLHLGLLDELRIDLVPVLFGEGVRYFGSLDAGKSELEQVEVVAGQGVTHLRYRVHYR